MKKNNVNIAQKSSKFTAKRDKVSRVEVYENIVQVKEMSEEEATLLMEGACTREGVCESD